MTGASRGVGRGIARALGEIGATVYVTGRTVRGAPATDALPGDVETTAREVDEAGGEGIPVRCDHADDEDVERLFAAIGERHGRLDLLVNNVWGGYEGYDSSFDASFWEQPVERWDRMFVVGARAHFTASRIAAPAMIEHGSGLIVNISFGHRGRYLGSVPYDVAKAAVDRLAFAMARDLRPHGVAALSLYPGFVRTERVERGASEKELASTESPLYTGRAVAALARDPGVLDKTGRSFAVGDLAREYGFTDADGSRPPAFEISESSAGPPD